MHSAMGIPHLRMFTYQFIASSGFLMFKDVNTTLGSKKYL